MVKKYKISEHTIFVWHKHFGELPRPNGNSFRTLKAECDLDISALEEINAKIVRCLAHYPATLMIARRSATFRRRSAR